MKKITITLDDKSISNAIKEIRQYKNQIAQKALILQSRIAEELASEVDKNFSLAVVDDLLKGGTRKADVQVSIGALGQAILVIASGEDAIWCEFGSGVYHNAKVGTSPHPDGEKLGFTIGSYGKGFGSREVWGFYQDGELKLTHGTPAQLPFYNAVKTVSAKIEQIAKEVFN